MNEVIYLTEEGSEQYKVELEQLKGPARNEMAKRLRDAIQQGDLSENADYIKAKEDQGFLEGRIQELEYILENATIIEQNNGQHEIVDVGAKVTIQEGDYPPDTYLMVGKKEANPQKGRISNESPIGQALLGKREGDVVTAQTPSGEIQFKILRVE